jgi:GntR family transcriptional regulator, transcriptional repressor for pyruvate dehydrogenase complex
MAADAAVAAVFEPVQTPTTFEETVERLGTAIRLGILVPGSRLPPERELAEQLAISRSTLREAIGALVESGHLTAVRGRGGGTFVVPEPPLAEGSAGPLPDGWRDVLGLRVAVEIGALTLAAERIGPEPLRIMREAVERMDAAVDFEEYRRADVRFHIALAEATGTPRLVAVMTEVQGQMSELISLIAHPKTVLEHANVEHRRIVKCLRGGDGVGAIRILREHLAGTEHIIAGLIPSEAAGVA